MKIISLLTLGLLSVATSAFGKSEFSSPNRSLRAEIDGQTISVFYKDAAVFSNVHVGMVAQNCNLDSALVLKSEGKVKKLKANYEMVAGKRLHCTNAASEKILVYANPDGVELKVYVRLYNDGLAIRYGLPNNAIAVEERTSYSIADGVNRWIATYDYGYEQPFPYATNGQGVKDKNGRMHDDGAWGYPALIEPQNGVFALLAEADVRRGDCCSFLNNKKDKEQYQVQLVSSSAFSDHLSPWRCAIIGSLADVVESTLITDLSTPSKIKDEKWIKPGVSSWIYWAYNHSSKDFKIVKEYIDLAVKMGWPYCLVDWEWPEMKNGGDINDVMAYAKEKGIGINLWYNSGTDWIGPGAPQPIDRLNNPENRERELQWLEDIGVRGIKVDFFSRATPEIVNYYIDLLEDAARHHLMVDFHGCTIPNGWQRTYPNMMSMEAIYGAEWYNNGPWFGPQAATHNATVAYTRNVIGPMDYTPGSFTDSQNPHVTTNTHELALPILFESALQHMADRPAGYEALPEEARQVYSTLPSVWDDTKLLSGYPGKSVVMARRSGKKWYVAGINGLAEAADLSFSLERLGLKNYSSVLFRDSDADRKIEVAKMPSDSKQLSVSCRARGGFLLVLEGK